MTVKHAKTLQTAVDNLETCAKWLREIANDLKKNAKEDGGVRRQHLWHIIQDLEYIADMLQLLAPKLKHMARGG